MARYFFNIHNGKVHLDRNGAEMTDLAAVRSEAIRAAGEALRELDGGFWEHGEWWM